MSAVAIALYSVAAMLSQAAEPEAVSPLTGHAFAQALEQPFAATWENVDLRRITRRITATRGTTLLVDRRLDPSRQHSLTANGEPLGTFLEQLAEKGGGSLSVTSSVAYLGPTEAALKLRTLIFMRQNELSVDEKGIPRARRAELSQSSTFAWDDLSQPAEIVRHLAEQRHLEMEGAERIPYDLWAGATVPHATLAEALSLVLIQFDLTFEWLGRGERIRIVPAPEKVTFERGHLPGKGQTPAAAVAQWREQIPQLEARIAGAEVVVRGTFEQHEALDRLRHGSVNAHAKKPPRLEPLKQKRYNLRIKDKPVRVLLEALSEPANGQLTFDYDANALKQAGIDLEQRVTFEVKNATIEQLLKAALDPLKVAFELDDRTVRLKPAKE